MQAFCIHGRQPNILPERKMEYGGVNAFSSFRLACMCMCAKSLQLCPTLCNPVAHQVPQSMGFSSQEYWSRLPYPPPVDLPDPEIKPKSLVSPALAGQIFTTKPPGKLRNREWWFLNKNSIFSYKRVNGWRRTNNACLRRF